MNAPEGDSSGRGSIPTLPPRIRDRMSMFCGARRARLQGRSGGIALACRPCDVDGATSGEAPRLHGARGQAQDLGGSPLIDELREVRIHRVLPTSVQLLWTEKGRSYTSMVVFRGFRLRASPVDRAEEADEMERARWQQKVVADPAVRSWCESRSMKTCRAPP